MFNEFFICGTIKELRFAITPLRKMECLHGEPASSSKTTNSIFFTVDNGLAVISFVRKMTVVIFIMLLLCGKIQTLLSQNVTSTTNWLKCES